MWRVGMVLGWAWTWCCDYTVIIAACQLRLENLESSQTGLISNPKPDLYANLVHLSWWQLYPAGGPGHKSCSDSLIPFSVSHPKSHLLENPVVSSLNISSVQPLWLWPGSSLTWITAFTWVPPLLPRILYDLFSAQHRNFLLTDKSNHIPPLLKMLEQLFFLRVKLQALQRPARFRVISLCFPMDLIFYHHPHHCSAPTHWPCCSGTCQTLSCLEDLAPLSSLSR